MGEMSTWESMRTRIHAQLERQTGAGVAEWNERIAAAGPADERALRRWLAERDVTGYPQMLLVYETFGYPDFLLATADELVDGQYEDRPQLRPIFDAVLADPVVRHGQSGRGRVVLAAPCVRGEQLIPPFGTGTFASFGGVRSTRDAPSGLCWSTGPRFSGSWLRWPSRHRRWRPTSCPNPSPAARSCAARVSPSPPPC